MRFRLTNAGSSHYLYFGINKKLLLNNIIYQKSFSSLFLNAYILKLNLLLNSGVSS